MKGLTQLTEFLQLLTAHGRPFSLHHYHPEAITVAFALPDERYEVYFLEDHAKVSVFAGDDGVSRDLEPAIAAIREL